MERKWKLLLVLVAVLGISAFVVGCAEEKPTTTPTPAETPKPTPKPTPTPVATPKYGKTEVVIGVIGPMMIPDGIAERRGAALAVEEINAQGGILGLPVRLVVGNTKLDPTVASAEFRRLATEEKADMVTGGFSSGVMAAMMETMAETKTVFLAEASSPVLSGKVAEDYEKYKYWFRISPTNGTTMAWDLIELVDFLNKEGKLNIKKVYVIRDEHIWTDPVMKYLTPELEKRGIEVVGDVKVPRGYTDYELLLLDAQSKGADLIMPILAIVQTGDSLVKQWAELKVPIIIAGHSFDFIHPDFYERTDGAANYVIFVGDGGVVPTAPTTEKARAFVEAYKERYGFYPESHTPFGTYDAVYAYKMAVEMAAKNGEKNPFDPDVVVKYLEKINSENPVEVTRVIAWYKNHDLVWGDDYIRYWPAQWQDGKQVIIWPPNVATGELKLPDWIKR